VPAWQRAADDRGDAPAVMGQPGPDVPAQRQGRHADPTSDTLGAVPGQRPAPDADTVTMAAVPAVETAVIPKVVESPPEPPPSLPGLAARHGLSPAGTRPTFGAYLGQVWRYRQFIATYANGRTIAAFGESRLGRLWQVLTPLMNAAVYFLIFGIILDTRRGMDNFIGYLCIGLFIFTYTQNVISAAVQAISGQLGLVRALQFPRASLPIAMTLAQAQNLVASMVVLGGIVALTGERVTVEWLWLVPTLVLQSMFNLGIALVVARMGAKVSDLKHLMPYVLRIWMYCSGILYNVAVFVQHLPAWASDVVHANPLLVYIELARYAMMDNPPLASSFRDLWIMGGAWAVVTLGFGFIYFWRGESEYGRG
jgi:teichoic acid transport system permease protein